jgi:hypothetical protein
VTESAFPPVRPTKRCLDDLGLIFPSLESPLSDIDHPIVKRSQQTPAEFAAGGCERVKSLNDRVWFKCKTSIYRAAVTRLERADTTEPELLEVGEAWWWIGAAGERRDDSASDFYKQIEAEATRAGKGYGKVSSTHLLPKRVDLERLEAEIATEAVVSTRRIVCDLIASSLKDGKLWSATLTGHEIKAGVRTKDGEAYLAIFAEGFPDARMIAVILNSVPYMTADDWLAEPGGAMGIAPKVGQIIYSAIISAAAQTAILDACSSNED